MAICYSPFNDSVTNFCCYMTELKLSCNHRSTFCSPWFCPMIQGSLLTVMHQVTVMLQAKTLIWRPVKQLLNRVDIEMRSSELQNYIAWNICDWFRGCSLVFCAPSTMIQCMNSYNLLFIEWILTNLAKLASFILTEKKSCQTNDQSFFNIYLHTNLHKYLIFSVELLSLLSSEVTEIL